MGIDGAIGGGGKESNADALRFKGDICSCKELLAYRVHVRFCSHEGLDNSKVAFEACIVKRRISIQYVHCITQGKYDKCMRMR